MGLSSASSYTACYQISYNFAEWTEIIYRYNITWFVFLREGNVFSVRHEMDV
jgi:hypothetical protein